MQIQDITQYKLIYSSSGMPIILNLGGKESLKVRLPEIESEVILSVSTSESSNKLYWTIYTALSVAFEHYCHKVPYTAH